MDFLDKVKKAAVEMSNAMVETAKDVAEQAVLAKLKSEQKEAGFFNFSEKKDIQKKIDRKKAERDAIYEALTFTKEQLAKLRQMFPDSYAMKEDIEKYETNLRRIEQKF